MRARQTPTHVRAEVAAIVSRARAAQRTIADADQARADELAVAAAWAIVEPSRNRALAELAVRDTGMGDVADKIAKNRRKTMGLLRDLAGMRTAGIIAEDRERGLVEIARPVGVVAAITPSTNPGATPANNIVNALKARNAIVLAPSPKGATTLARLIEYVHAELDRVHAPRDLVQMLPAPVSREHTRELMRQADLVVATGSQNNVRSAYQSGTPALGVGAGNVAVIVDETANIADAAAKIAASKTFDHATSCSSENSVIAVASVADALVAALAGEGGVRLDREETLRLSSTMFPDGKLAPAVVAQSAATIAGPRGFGAPEVAGARFLIVDEDGVGPAHPVLGREALAGPRALPGARLRCGRGARGRDPRLPGRRPLGRPLHGDARARDATRPDAPGRPRDREPGALLRHRRRLRQRAAVLAVDGLRQLGRQQLLGQPQRRHFLNVTRVVHPLAPAKVREPTEDELFGAYRKKHRL
jgi:sulfoacetaldehyde dehydrogenase